MQPLLRDLAFHTAGVFALVFWGWELILYSCSPPAQSLLLGGGGKGTALLGESH